MTPDEEPCLAAVGTVTPTGGRAPLAPPLACADVDGKGGGLMSRSGTDVGAGIRVSRALVLFIYGFAIVCTVE